MTAAGYGLALVRIAYGVYMLNEARRKTAGGWLTSGVQLAEAVQPRLESAEALYRPFLTDVVLPNATTFSLLVTIGEWAVALSLILGLLTRLGSAIGVVLMANYLLMKGLASALSGDDTWLFLVVFVGLGLGAAGLIWGLDGPLARAMPPVRPLTGGARRPANTPAD